MLPRQPRGSRVLPGPFNLVLFHFPHLLFCSSSGCGERWRLGKEVGSGEGKGCLDALALYSLFLQPEERKGRKPFWLQKLEKNSLAVSGPGPCARRYPKPRLTRHIFLGPPAPCGRLLYVKINAGVLGANSSWGFTMCQALC